MDSRETQAGKGGRGRGILKKRVSGWLAQNKKESRRESNRKMRRESRRPGGHGEHGEENEKYQVMLEVKEKLLVEKIQHQSKKSTRTSCQH